MSLYYEDEYVQLHHGDCRAVRGWTEELIARRLSQQAFNFAELSS